MTPISVSLKGFGSFKNVTRFDFPKGPGLHLMSGLNLVEPRLGTNGAGKTTLWNAIRWAIFDRAANGLRAGDVVNWDAPKGAWVSFTFEHDGGTYEVFRKHSPNEWIMHDLDTGEPIELVDDETNPLFAMLRLRASTWDQCVLMAQGEQTFLDLKPEPKAALFSEVMGLDQWLRASDTASKRAEKALDQARSIDRRIAEVQGALDGLDSLEDVQRDYDQFEAEVLRRIDDYREQHRAKNREADKLLEESHRCAADVATVEAHVRKLVDKRNSIYDNSEAEYKALTTARERRAVAAAECDRLERLLNNLHDNRVCPTCGAPDAHKGPAAREAKAQMNAADVTLDECNTAVGACEDEYNAAAALLRKHDELTDRAKLAMDATRDNERGNRFALETAERHVLRLLDLIDEERDRVNPHKQRLDEGRMRVHKLRRELDQLRERHRHAAEKSALLGFWVRGFKDLRLRQIDSALGELEAETAACLSDLGLEGWELRFDVDKETKSGSVRPGFSVHVRSPRNDKPVPWDSWSGGEKQRLKVAAQMGLANLIRSGTGADIDLEVWDEPTQGMNARGIADLLASLKERATLEKRQIWVIDHHTLGYSDFDSIVTVVKDEEGSRFDYGQE